MEKRIIVFDFDGVLADSFFVWFKVVREAFASIGLELTSDQYLEFYEQNVKEGQRAMIGDKQKFQKVQSHIRENIANAYRQVKLFPFAKELINSLSPLAILIVVSSTPSEVIKAKLNETGLEQSFALVLGAEGETTKKKKFEKVSSELNSQPSKMFFVSDTTGDIIEAKEFGFKTLAVAWGFHSRELLQTAGPDRVCDDYNQLLGYLKKL